MNDKGLFILVVILIIVLFAAAAEHLPKNTDVVSAACGWNGCGE